MKNKKKIMCCVAPLVLLSLCSCISYEDIDLKKLVVEVEVVDDKGTPLDDADVAVTFRHTALQDQRLGRTSFRMEKKTKEGKPAVFKYSSSGRTSVFVRKEGYCPAGEAHVWRAGDQVKGKNYKRRFKIVLQPKINPRPLYAHDATWTSVPELGKPYGYDLEKADWVAPYGNGMHSDFIFTINQKVGEKRTYESSLNITFSNSEDGIRFIEGESHSKLLLGHEAPEGGYSNKYERTKGIVEVDGKRMLKESISFEELKKLEGAWFRVRTEVDKQTGKATKARYGKIQGYVEYSFEPRELKESSVGFVYYLAPDHSRSVEYNGESLVENANLQCVTKH